jgi:hypothetical protein
VLRGFFHSHGSGIFDDRAGLIAVGTFLPTIAEQWAILLLHYSSFQPSCQNILTKKL